jgi:hypothetical protein
MGASQRANPRKLGTNPPFLSNIMNSYAQPKRKSVDGDWQSENMKILLICLAAALLGGCADGDYVGPRLDFTPSNGPNYTFPPKAVQRAGKNVVEAEDAL